MDTCLTIIISVPMNFSTGIAHRGTHGLLHSGETRGVLRTWSNYAQFRSYSLVIGTRTPRWSVRQLFSHHGNLWSWLLTNALRSLNLDLFLVVLFMKLRHVITVDS